MQVFRTTYNHSNNPYAVSRLSSGEELLWDNAGNLCHREDKSRHQHFYWTEDNRMQAYYSQQDAVNTVAYYRYDASGERDLKLLGVVESVKIQAVDYRIPILKPKPGKEYSDAVLYASPLMTVNSTGYTKHYFAESERILSNVAGGRSRPLVPVDLELKSITGEEPAELAANFMVFVGDYLKQASGGTCSPSDINYIAHIQKFPPLATIFADRVAADYRDERYFYHSDHLSGASMITNVGGGLHQTLAYCPYGEPLVDIKNGNYDERYQFTGYEKDGESGLNYAHSRYDWDYGGIFISTDPMWFKYPNLTSYAYCGNNPISYIDPDGRDAILIVFPDYLVDPDLHIKRTIPFINKKIDWKMSKLPLGHAGVLLIDNATGTTKYYEYGRYKTKDGTKGRVRASATGDGLSLSNVIIDKKTGKPTQKSLNKVLGEISAKAGDRGRIEGAYIEGEFSVMNAYAQQKMKESNFQYKEYNKERSPYDIWTNNCGTFGIDVIKQDKQAQKRAPWIVSPTPDNVAEEYQDNFPYVRYNPQTNQTTSNIYE